MAALYSEKALLANVTDLFKLRSTTCLAYTSCRRDHLGRPERGRLFLPWFPDLYIAKSETLRAAKRKVLRNDPSIRLITTYPPNFLFSQTNRNRSSAAPQASRVCYLFAFRTNLINLTSHTSLSVALRLDLWNRRTRFRLLAIIL